jgi:purine-binding chemotaxis protein CheW
VKVLVLPLGEEHYALPLESVQQIISEPRVTRMPISDPAILGLLNVRGDIVPLFDAAVLLGSGAHGAADFAILVGTSEGPAALGVGVMPDASEIDAEPGAGGGSGEPQVYPADGRLVTLLAIEDLLVAGRTGQPRAS